MPPNPRSNISLTNLANTYLGFRENQRRQAEHELAQKTGEVSLQQMQDTLKSNREARQREEQERQRMALSKVIDTADRYGANNPYTHQVVAREGAPFGVSRLEVTPEGEYIFYGTGRKADTDPRTPTGGTYVESSGPQKLFRLNRKQINEALRREQFGERKEIDAGDRTVLDYPSSRLREEVQTAAKPLSEAEEGYYNARKGYYNAAAAAETANPSDYDFDDLDSALRNYREVNAINERHPLSALIDQLQARAVILHPYSPIKQRNYIFSRLPLSHGREGGAGTPNPDVHNPRGGAADDAGGGEGTPTLDAPPGPARQAAPQKTEADRVSSRISELEQRRSDPSLLARGFDWMRPEVIVGEEREERGREEQELRQRYYDLTGESHEESQLKQTMVQLQEQFSRQASNPALADAAAQTRKQIADLVGAINAEHQRAVATYGDKRADVAGAPAPAKGSARGGEVRAGRHRGAGLRAPRGGTVDMMAGTEIPEGTETRMRNLRRGVDESLGLGIRVLPGREF